MAQWIKHQTFNTKVVGSSPAVTNVLCSWVRCFAMITPLHQGENGNRHSMLGRYPGSMIIVVVSLAKSL